jgi:hypothetical protein
MRISLAFKSYDSKSTITVSWQDGEIVKRYNSQKPYRSSMPTPPQSVEAFEAICRQRFLLGQKWQAVSVVGVAV